MSIMPVNMDHFATIEKVAELKHRGVSDTQIAKQLNLMRKEVISYYEDYKTLLRNDSDAHDRAMDLLNSMVVQYDELIAEYWTLVGKIRSETFDDKYAGQENKALAQIGDLIAKRLDAVQKAGLLEAGEIGSEYAEIEEKANLLISILRSDLCNDCRMRVKDKLAVATNQVEAVVVYDETD